MIEQEPQSIKPNRRNKRIARSVVAVTAATLFTLGCTNGETTEGQAATSAVELEDTYDIPETEGLEEDRKEFNVVLDGVAQNLGEDIIIASLDAEQYWNARKNTSDDGINSLVLSYVTKAQGSATQSVEYRLTVSSPPTEDFFIDPREATKVSLSKTMLVGDDVFPERDTEYSFSMSNKKGDWHINERTSSEGESDFLSTEPIGPNEDRVQPLTGEDFGRRFEQAMRVFDAAQEQAKIIPIMQNDPSYGQA